MAASSSDVAISVNQNPADAPDARDETSDDERLQREAESRMVPFVPSKLMQAAKWTLDLLDDWGERLAFMFGITSPKYAVQINAHNRMRQQDTDRNANQVNEFAGWRSPPAPQHGYTNPAADPIHVNS